MPAWAAVPNEAPSKITWSSSAVAESAAKRFSSSPLAPSSRWARSNRSSSKPSRSFGLPSTWSRSASISLASPSRCGTLGRKTDAVSPERRARTNRPIACAKYSGVLALVAYTPTASRGMSTPSDTIRTATSHRCWEAANVAIRADAPWSSESTTAAFSPVTCSSSFAYERATCWSLAMTRPPASGMPLARSTLSRASAARSTCGIQSPAGSSAVRHAWAIRSCVIGSPRRAASSSPAFVRQRVSPEYARNSTGRTTPSRSASE